MHHGIETCFLATWNQGLEHWAFSYGALVSLHKDFSLSGNLGFTI
jgi:hypothetical protein